MRVFVAGAGGVIGAPLIAALLQAGHEVAAMTRDSQRAEQLGRQGTTPVICDAYEEASLNAALEAVEPEVVISHLTDLAELNAGRMKEAWLANDRLRTVGVPNLVRAAQAAGARRFVVQSIAFIYAPSMDGPADESAPLYLDHPQFGATVRAALAMERSVLEAEGIEGVALRFGFWYGPGTGYAAAAIQAKEVRKRRFPIGAGGTGVWSWIHLDDVVATSVAALDRGQPGTYNVVDDDPAAVGEWLPAYAAAIGAKRPLRAPTIAVRLAAGSAGVHMMKTNRGADNSLAKREFGWTPKYPSWREGFRDALG